MPMRSLNVPEMVLITSQAELMSVVLEYSCFAPDLLTVKICTVLGLLILDAEL